MQAGTQPWRAGWTAWKKSGRGRESSTTFSAASLRGLARRDLECMEAYLNHETEYGWYLCLDSGRIVSGLGVIENDFHDRKDLTPNVCAVYTEKEYRCQGIAGQLLDIVVKDMKSKGITPIYLITDHTSFYERYGWEFLCMVQEDNETDMTRMYMLR